MYLLNRENLGGFKQGSGGGDNVVQRIGPYGGVWSRPGVWPGEGGWVYIPTASPAQTSNTGSGNLRIFKYGLSGTGQPTLSLQATSPDAFGFGSGAPVITSNGTKPRVGARVDRVGAEQHRRRRSAARLQPDPRRRQARAALERTDRDRVQVLHPRRGSGPTVRWHARRQGARFGSPVTPLLTGPATEFPTTTIGSSSSQQTLTLTATNALTLKALKSSSSQFTVGTPSPALPAALAAGQTIRSRSTSRRRRPG